MNANEFAVVEICRQDNQTAMLMLFRQRYFTVGRAILWLTMNDIFDYHMILHSMRSLRRYNIDSILNSQKSSP